MAIHEVIKPEKGVWYTRCGLSPVAFLTWSDKKEEVNCKNCQRSERTLDLYTKKKPVFHFLRGSKIVCNNKMSAGARSVRDRQKTTCKSCLRVLNAVNVPTETVRVNRLRYTQLNIEIAKLRKLVESVNEHAETCNIFVMNGDMCTCFYKKIEDFKNE
jgi:hypothetical protein